MSEDDLREMGRRMQGKHPNTYTMTKAMAEWVVAEQADDIPAAIVRPSIGMNVLCYILMSYMYYFAGTYYLSIR